jgi:DedD protein
MAENRREKNRRYYFTKGQMALLGGAFTFASVIIFALGMLVGKEIESRKTARPDEPLLKVPIKPPASGGADSGRGKDDLTFYNTLKKTPSSIPGGDSKAEDPATEKNASLAAKDKKAQEKEMTGSRAKTESRADKAAAPPPSAGTTPTVDSADSKNNGKNWTVQANSYPDTKSANDLVDRLKNRGYNAFVTQADVKGKVWYRVRIGPFASREEAEKTVAALRSNEDLGKAFATRQ